MNKNQTTFNDIKLIPFPYFNDNRGVFTKIYNENVFKEYGINVSFKESFISISHKDVIRGMHFQTPPYEQDKVISVVQGSIKDVIVDLRSNSANYGKFQVFDLKAKNPSTLFIPAGFAHGFISLEDNTIVSYLVTSCYSKDHDKGILFSSFNYSWPCENFIISDRDLSFPTLADFKSPF